MMASGSCIVSQLFKRKINPDMFSSHYISIDNWTLLGVRGRYPAARTLVETWSAAWDG